MGRFSNKASQKTCQNYNFITELSGEKPEMHCSAAGEHFISILSFTEVHKQTNCL